MFNLLLGVWSQQVRTLMSLVLGKKVTNLGTQQ
jgi:hypothetical protein